MTDTTAGLQAAITYLRPIAESATVGHYGQALTVVLDALEASQARLREAEAVIEKCRPVVENARGDLMRIEGEWGSSRSFADLVEQRDEDAVDIQTALDALTAYKPTKEAG